MSKEKFATAHYLGGMAFEAESGSGHRLVMDTSEADGGQNTGFSPMEIPLIALIGCMGMDITSTLNKMRQNLTDYSVSAHGTRAETHPQVFVTIEVEHVFTGHDLTPASVRRAVELSATRYCSVSGMLNKTATIRHTLILVDANTGERTEAEPLIEGVGAMTATDAPSV
jgi:putative redox protein